jgi:hypothetical protein
LNQARLALLASLPGTQIRPKGVLSVDDTLLTHYGQEFEQIAKLFDPVSNAYVWAHDLVTLHYSDDETDYPPLFQLWQPVDLAKLEQGLRAAGIPLKASKAPLKESDSARWRGYLLGVWQRRRKNHHLHNFGKQRLVINLLRAAQHDPDLRDQLQRQLKVKLEGHPAAWRRAAQAQSLWCLGLFISAGLAQGQSLQAVMAPLLRAICRA